MTSSFSEPGRVKYRRQRQNPVRRWFQMIVVVMAIVGLLAWAIYIFNRPAANPANSSSVPEDSTVQFH